MKYSGSGACEGPRLRFAVVCFLFFAQQDFQVSKATDCDNDSK